MSVKFKCNSHMEYATNIIKYFSCRSKNIDFNINLIERHLWSSKEEAVKFLCFIWHNRDNIYFQKVKILEDDYLRIFYNSNFGLQHISFDCQFLKDYKIH